MVLVLSTVRRDPLIQPEVCTLTAVIWGSEKPTLRVNAQQAGASRAGRSQHGSSTSPELTVIDRATVRAKSDTKLDCENDP